MHKSLVRGVAAAALVAAVAAAGLVGCEPAPNTYVAIGDSYAAGPLIPTQVGGAQAGCDRSNNNYPTLARPKIKVERLVDVTCSAATTDHLLSAQDTRSGAHAPQANALGASTKVVTMQFGGNDIGFGDILQTCIKLLPWLPPCRDAYLSGGRDQLRARIDAAAPRIARAIAEVKRRAPQATVFVVGYPTIIPETGEGCWSPIVPLLGPDVVYLRGVAKYLNAMLASEATKAKVAYVDLATPSIGRDVCAGTARWVEPLVPGLDAEGFAAPVHPNLKGMTAFADIVARAVNAKVTA
jgi:lysophospholipase L1-like esterase